MKVVGISLLIYIFLLVVSSFLNKIGVVLYSEVIIFFVSLVIVSIFVKTSKIKNQKEIILIAAFVAIYFTIIPLILNGADYFIEDIVTRISRTVLFFIASYIGSGISLYLVKRK